MDLSQLAISKAISESTPVSATMPGLDIQVFLAEYIGILHDRRGQIRQSTSHLPISDRIPLLWKAQIDILFLQWSLVRFSGAVHVFQEVNDKVTGSAEVAKAIAQLEAILNLQSDEYPGKPYRHASLGGLYNAHWELHGDKQDLSKSIKNYDAAVSLLDDSDPKKAEYTAALAAQLETRARLYGAKNDFLAAIQRAHDTVRLLLNPDPLDPQAQIRLALAHHAMGRNLMHRFEALFDNIDDIDRASACFENAEQALPSGHEAKIIIFSDLCYSHVLRSRYHTQKDVRLDEAKKDIENAMLQFSKVPTGPEPDHPGYAIFLNAKCMAYTKHHKLVKVNGAKSQFPPDIQEAIRVGEMAAAHSVGSSQESFYLFNLGKAHLSLHRELKSDQSRAAESLKSLGNANDCFHYAARCELGDHMVKFKAARNWAKAQSKRMEIEKPLSPIELLKAYELNTILLSQIAAHHIPIHEQYRRLEKVQTIVHQATAAAIKYGYPGKAAEFFEEGRSVIWKHYFKHDVTTQSLEEKDPELAADYKKQTTLFTQECLSESNTNLLMEKTYLENKKPTYRVMQLRSDFMATIQKIKDLDEFTFFHTYQRLSFLEKATTHGTVVLLNLSTHCDALILRKDQPILHIRIPRMISSEVTALRKKVQDSLAGIGMARGMHEWTAREQEQEDTTDNPKKVSEKNFADVLEKLWKNLVVHILKALGLTQPPSSKGRIFWCLSGQLAFLPIHAAGIYGSESHKSDRLSEYFHSSYIPNMLSLLRHRPDDSTERPFRFLAIAQSTSKKFNPLPGTKHEVDAIGRCFKNGAKILRDEDNTLERVKEELQVSQWAHFACHGVQDSVDGLQSGLILNNDIRLTLKELVALKIKNAELAYLSACQSAKGDNSLPDENIHLAAGMLVAGYKGVIATMWEIGDDEGRAVAESVYAELLGNQGKGKAGVRPDFKKAVFALNKAVEKLKLKKDSAQFVRWVPFIHIGL